MPINYTPVPGNAIGKALIEPIPADGVDGFAAAGYQPGFKTLADYTAYMQQVLAAVGATNWTQATGSITGVVAIGARSDIPDSAVGAITLVAVGAGGGIATSPDGLTWTSRTSGTAATLNGVAWNGTVWVAVGALIILHSADAITWVAITRTETLNSIAWSPALSLWCAVGNGGKILTSPDGITWTARTSGTINPLLGIAWGANVSGGLFAVTASAVTNTILTSPDGITWTIVGVATTTGSTNGGGIWANYSGVFAGATKFVAILQVGSIYYPYSSTDGATWTQGTALSTGVPAGWNPLAWNGRQWLYGGLQGGTSTDYWSSLDGVTWIKRVPPGGTVLAGTDIPQAIAGNTTIGQFYAHQNAAGNVWRSLMQPLP